MIIGLSGKKQVGKDTVARAIQYLFDKRNELRNPLIKNFPNFEKWITWGRSKELSSTWHVKKFAYSVKQVCSILTGIPIEDFEKEEVKSSYLGKEWDYVTMSDGWIPTYYNPDNNGCEEPSEPIYNRLTIRELLQKVGTDAMRDVVHPDVWVNALMRQYGIKDLEYFKAYPDNYGLPSWIISDVRFPNEAKAIKDRDGICIQIKREGNKLDSHISEIALDGYHFDYTIENNRDTPYLIEEVKEMLIHFKL